MADSRRSQVAAIGIVLGLIAFALLLILNLNLLSWPVGVSVGGQSGGAQQVTSTIQPGVLSVNLTSAVYNVSQTGKSSGANLSAISMSGIRVSITRQGAPAPMMIGATTTGGSFKILLAPGPYNVGILSDAFNNLTVSVQIFESKVTHLSALLNVTNYRASSFNVVESESSANWIGSWNEVYALVTTGQPIPSGATVRDYISISRQASSSSPPPVGTIVQTPPLIQITLDSQGNTTGGARWVQFHVNQLADIDAINGLSIVTYKVTYTLEVGDY